MNTIINRLLESHEPAIRYKTRVNVLGELPDSPEIRYFVQSKSAGGGRIHW
jgi:hypothetical protein